MKRQNAILLFVLGYLIYLSYVSLETVKMIENVDNKVKAKTNRIK